MNPPSDSLDRVFTAANVLSLSRLVCVGLAIWLMFGPNERIAAGSLFAVAGVTDCLDGYVARRFGQVSNIGKMLDPTVDRMVVVASAISIAVYGAIPLAIVVIVLAREVFVAVAALVLAALHAGRIEVLFIGKVSTFGLFTCLPIFLAGDGAGPWAHAANIIAWVVAIPSLAVSMASIGFYFPQAKRALTASRESSLG